MLDFIIDEKAGGIVPCSEKNSFCNSNEEKIIPSICRGKGVYIEYLCKGNGPVVFRGCSNGTEIIDRMTIDLNESTYKMLINAINNRTRERNYFRLYSELKDEIISEEEFERKLDSSEDDFVVCTDIIPSMEDVKKALFLSKQIKDVETSEDLSSLFSFDSKKTVDLLKEIDSSACISSDG